MSKHSGGKNKGKPVVGLHNKREANAAFQAFASLAIEMSNNLRFQRLRKWDPVKMYKLIWLDTDHAHSVPW